MKTKSIRLTILLFVILLGYLALPFQAFSQTSNAGKIFKSVNPTTATVGDTVTWTLVTQSAPATVGDLYSSGTTWGGAWTNQVAGTYSWGVSNSALWYGGGACVTEADFPQYINSGVTVGDAEFYYETLIPPIACQPLEDSVLIFRNVACNRFFLMRLDHYQGSDGCPNPITGMSKMYYGKVIPNGNPCGSTLGYTNSDTEHYGANIDCVAKNTWYSMRVRTCGTTILAKAWQAGLTEPAIWQLSTTDSDLATYPTGSFGFQANQGQTAFRNLTVSTIQASSVTAYDAISSCISNFSVMGSPSQGSVTVSGNGVTWNVGTLSPAGEQASLTLSSVITACALGSPVSNVASCTGGGYAAVALPVSTRSVAYTPTSTPTRTPTASISQTAGVSNTVTRTVTPTPTSTNTYQTGVSLTLSPTRTPTVTATRTFTSYLTPTTIFTTMPSNTPSFTFTPTNTYQSGVTFTPTPTFTWTPNMGTGIRVNLIKSQSVSFLNAGDTITYTLNYSILNSATSGYFYVTDTLPTDITYVGETYVNSGSSFVSFGKSAQTLDWTIFAPAPGITGSVSWWGVVGCPASGAITDVAHLDGINGATDSNQVVAHVACGTSTPGITATVPMTFTTVVTTTPTRTFTSTPTATGTPTMIWTAPVSVTATVSRSYTFTPTTTNGTGITMTVSPTPTPGGISLQVTNTLYGGWAFSGALTVVASVCNLSAGTTANGVTLTDVIGYGSTWFAWSGPYSSYTVDVGGATVTVGNSIDTTNFRLTVENLPGGKCVPVTMVLSDYNAASRPCTHFVDFLTAYGPGMSGPVTSSLEYVYYGACFSPTFTSTPIISSPTNTPSQTNTVPVSLTTTPMLISTMTPTPSFTFTGSPTSTPILTVGTSQTILPTVGVGCVRVQVDGKTNCNDTLPSNAAQAAIAVKIPVTPGQNYLITIVDGCISYGSNFVNGVPSSLYGTRLRVFQADDSVGTNLTQLGTVGNGSYMQYTQASIGLDQAVSLHDLSTTCEDAKSVGLSAPYNGIVFNVSKPYLYLSADDIYYGYCGDNVGVETVDVCGTTLVASSPTATSTPTPTATWTPTPFGQPTATSTNTLVVTPGCNLLEVKGKANCVDTVPSNAAEATVAVKVPVTAGTNYRITLMSGCISYGSDTPNGVPSSLYGTRLRIFGASDTVGTGLNLIGHVGDGSYMQYMTSGFCGNISKGVSMGALFTTAAAAWADTTSKGLDSVVVTATQGYLYLDTDDIYLGYCGDNTGSEWVQVCATTDPPFQGGNTPTKTLTPTMTGTVPVSMTVSPTWTQSGVSLTLTPMVSATFTPSGTNTSTVTPTMTMPVSLMVSATFTPSGTNTSTVTPAMTMPVSLMVTATYTPTSTWTATVSVIFSPTVTFTTTPTYSTVWSQTPTPVFPGKGVAHHPQPYPNPSHGGHVYFNLDGGPYDQVTILIFTTSGRQVYRKIQLGKGEEEMILAWDSVDNHRGAVADGLYNVFLETHYKNEVRTYKEKVVVLK
jgi:hypothetical protein